MDVYHYGKRTVQRCPEVLGRPCRMTCYMIGRLLPEDVLGVKGAPPSKYKKNLRLLSRQRWDCGSLIRRFTMGKASSRLDWGLFR